jgi:hypothetical protein
MENFEIEFNNALEIREKCIKAKKTCEESFINYMEELALNIYCHYYKFWNDHDNVLIDYFYLDIINTFGFFCGVVAVKKQTNGVSAKHIRLELLSDMSSSSKAVSIIAGEKYDGELFTKIDQNEIYRIPKIVRNVSYFTSGQFIRDFNKAIVKHILKDAVEMEYYENIMQQINKHIIQLKNDHVEHIIESNLK